MLVTTQYNAPSMTDGHCSDRKTLCPSHDGVFEDLVHAAAPRTLNCSHKVSKGNISSLAKYPCGISFLFRDKVSMTLLLLGQWKKDKEETQGRSMVYRLNGDQSYPLLPLQKKKKLEA